MKKITHFAKSAVGVFVGFVLVLALGVFLFVWLGFFGTSKEFFLLFNNLGNPGDLATFQTLLSNKRL